MLWVEVDKWWFGMAKTGVGALPAASTPPVLGLTNPAG
jgi:hypothetical protein